MYIRCFVRFPTRKSISSVRPTAFRAVIRRRAKLAPAVRADGPVLWLGQISPQPSGQPIKEKRPGKHAAKQRNGGPHTNAVAPVAQLRENADRKRHPQSLYLHDRYHRTMPTRRSLLHLSTASLLASALPAIADDKQPTRAPCPRPPYHCWFAPRLFHRDTPHRRAIWRADAGVAGPLLYSSAC